jgi:hypothetical protein
MICALLWVLVWHRPRGGIVGYWWYNTNDMNMDFHGAPIDNDIIFW